MKYRLTVKRIKPYTYFLVTLRVWFFFCWIYINSWLTTDINDIEIAKIKRLYKAEIIYK